MCEFFGDIHAINRGENGAFTALFSKTAGFDILDAHCRFYIHTQPLVAKISEVQTTHQLAMTELEVESAGEKNEELDCSSLFTTDKHILAQEDLVLKYATFVERYFDYLRGATHNEHANYIDQFTERGNSIHASFIKQWKEVIEPMIDRAEEAHRWDMRMLGVIYRGD